METTTTLAGSSENVAGHGESGGMSEVYAVTREFTEWGRGVYNRLPPRFRDGLRAAGVCHYVVIVKDPSGDLYSFDFGPVGGDVTGRLAGGRLPFDKSTSSPSLLALAKKEEEKEDSEAEEGVVKTRRGFSSVDDLNTAVTTSTRTTRTSASFEKNTSSNHEDVAESEDSSSSSAASASSASSSASPARRGDRLISLRSSISFKGGREFLSRANGVRGGGRTSTAGEIREGRLDALPEGHHFVGHTRLSLEDIRKFNASRDTAYSLHDNDCRHYLNDLCAHACPEVCGPGAVSVQGAAAAAAGPGSGSCGSRYGKYGRGGVASHVAWQNTWGRLKSGRPHEALHLIPLQAITDLSNLNTINRIKSACSASVVFGVGMRALPLLCRPVLGALPVGAVVSAVSLPGASKIGVAAAAGAGHLPARRLVTTAAGAVAGVSAEVPVVREALMVGNMALTGLTDVARGLVAGTSSVITAGVGLFASSSSSVSSVSSSVSAVSSATAAAAYSYSVTASATCEASAAAAAAAGASMVAAGTSRYSAGAAAATAIASSCTYQSSAVYAGTAAAAESAAAAAVAAAQTQVVSAQAALAARSLAVTKVAASASKVKAVAGRAARATQTIACAVGAGLKKITPYPRGGWGGGSSASPRVAAKRLTTQKQQQQQRRLSAGTTPSFSNAGGRGGGGKVPRPSGPRLSLCSDAALELHARAQRPRPFFSLRRRDRATTATAAATMAISA